MEGQHQRTGVTGEHTDRCSVLAHDSSLTSSLLSKRETDNVKTSVVAAPPSQFTRWELKAPALSLQCVGFCSTLPCLPLGCLVMSAAYLATNVSVYMQSLICLCACMKRQRRNQCWHTWLVLALEESCVHLFVWFSLCKQSCTGEAEYGAVYLKIPGARQEGANL